MPRSCQSRQIASLLHRDTSSAFPMDSAQLLRYHGEHKHSTLTASLPDSHRSLHRDPLAVMEKQSSGYCASDQSDNGLSSSEGLPNRDDSGVDEVEQFCPLDLPVRHCYVPPSPIHRVANPLTVIFANERVAVGDSYSICQGVANTTQKVHQLFEQEFAASVFVHWNKTGCEMLDYAREARLDLEYKDGLFVFILGSITDGWIMGGDGIAFPLQDLVQMFGLSNENRPMFFCAHHFPLPSSLDPEVMADPPPSRYQWSSRDFISLIENQAFMWLHFPATIDEFLRLLRANADGKDLALIMNQFAEWIRKSGQVRSLRMKRTFTKLVYLVPAPR